MLIGVSSFCFFLLKYYVMRELARSSLSKKLVNLLSVKSSHCEKIFLPHKKKTHLMSFLWAYEAQARQFPFSLELCLFCIVFNRLLVPFFVSRNNLLWHVKKVPGMGLVLPKSLVNICIVNTEHSSRGDKRRLHYQPLLRKGARAH